MSYQDRRGDFLRGGGGKKEKRRGGWMIERIVFEDHPKLCTPIFSLHVANVIIPTVVFVLPQLVKLQNTKCKTRVLHLGRISASAFIHKSKICRLRPDC